MKNGKHPSGTQRWRCRSCGASAIRKRDDVSRRHQLVRFLRWLLGKLAQSELSSKDRARQFRRETAWCWDLQPRLGPVTTAYHSILVDGIWVGSWCLLIAVTPNLQVLAWQWCARESTAAWTALLEQIPAPTVVACDGGTGLTSALRNTWPNTAVQRCLFHVQMNIRTYLTLHPRTHAGRRLLALSRQLSRVVTIEAAITWRQQLEAWWQGHGHLTKERTRYANGQYGFTHDRLRKAWQLLAKLARTGVLFTYLEHGNPRTTSPLEGGINNGIRTVLRNHRGMNEPHMKRAAEWFLTLQEIPLERAHELIPNSTDRLDTPNIDPEPTSLYDTGLTAEEGLWTRTGWAGKS